VALARAIVMDPDILIYDEPFVGLDPISMGVICRLIKQMNEALGITSIVVSHDVQELSTIAHDSFLLSSGKVVASGTPAELHASKLEEVRQPLTLGTGDHRFRRMQSQISWNRIQNSDRCRTRTIIAVWPIPRSSFPCR
jgi:ABC-type transporter Mla maintaining outer membrane lipid asymmetry ATPase subunit MlaF